MANTPTTYYAINKPASGDTGWGTTMNADMDIIDTALQGMAQLAGRAGGQTLYGDTAANGDLTLEPTSHGTKTTAYIKLAPSGGLIGLGAGSTTVLVNTTEPSVVGNFQMIGGFAKTYTGAVVDLIQLRSNEALASNPLELRVGFSGNATAASQGFVFQAGHYGADFTANLLLNPSGGYVGIGTTAPGALLDMQLDSAGAVGPKLRLTNLGGGVATGGQIEFVCSTATQPVQGVVRTQDDGNWGGIITILNKPYASGTSGALVEALRIDSGHNLGVGVSAVDSRLHVGIASANTSTVQQLLTLSANSTGTAAAGFGSRILWELESSTTDDQTAALLDIVWAEATHATRKARAVLTVYDTAARECMRAEASGTAPMLGFLGANASARLAHVADPAGGGTVDAEARSVINSILTTLETFGFHATS